MANTTSTDGQPGAPPATTMSAFHAAGRVEHVAALLESLDEQPPFGAPRSPPAPAENQLVEVRLGLASSLFKALRWKHEPTARHCLRVTLGCSAWAARLGLEGDDRDQLEVAALLHDLGKLGVPDSILAKPDPLTATEAAVMDGHWEMGLDMLRTLCASPAVLSIIEATPAWYDGTRRWAPWMGDSLPLGARMLSIMDAFDAMMSDHVYRRALPRERAFHELYRCAGTQFDPELVQLFTRLHECDQLKLRQAVAQRWLQALEPEQVNANWRLNEGASGPAARAPDSLFQQKLLANMFDAVIFIDSSLRVAQWNRGAERLTGISGQSAYQRQWLPSLLALHDEHGQRIQDEDCPVAHAFRTGVQWLRRLSIRGREGRPIAVDAHAVPAAASGGVAFGVVLLLHDVSPEISLEARCESLYEQATKDPLTQLANRAEFDRAHRTFVAVHLESQRPCSLIICDIDRFKRVNDTHGHQAGDEIIRSFARLLKSCCRPGDLVARYGGEEFVVLCADCDNIAAVERAEQMCRDFSEFKQPVLAGEAVTASFGVTEVQPGDTPETMLRRADRALLHAKQSGRNRVVQLGSGADPETASGGRPALCRRRISPDALIERDLISEAPLSVCVEKLRGFMADHHADVDAVDETRLRLIVAEDDRSLLRQVAYRPVRLSFDIQLREVPHSHPGTGGIPQRGRTRTEIHVIVSALKNRERRQKRAQHRAQQLYVSFKAYLMAHEHGPTRQAGVIGRARGIFGQWFGRE